MPEASSLAWHRYATKLWKRKRLERSEGLEKLWERPVIEGLSTKRKATAGDVLSFPKYSTTEAHFNITGSAGYAVFHKPDLDPSWPIKGPSKKQCAGRWNSQEKHRMYENQLRPQNYWVILAGKCPFFGLKIWQKRVWRKLPELPNRCGHAARAVACRWWRSSRAVIWQIVIVVTRSQQIPQCSESLLRPKIFGCLWLEVPH